MPENGSTDPEISGLLRHLQNKPNAEQAWKALRQYRTAALGELPTGVTRSQASEVAREELRSRLLHLLVNGQTVGPAVEYVVRRTLAVREFEQAIEDVRQRARLVWQEMTDHEARLNLFDGMEHGVAETAAVNNLGVRRLELDAELVAEEQRLSGEFRRKIGRLLEELEDEPTE